MDEFKTPKEFIKYAIRELESCYDSLASAARKPHPLDLINDTGERINDLIGLGEVFVAEYYGDSNPD